MRMFHLQRYLAPPMQSRLIGLGWVLIGLNVFALAMRLATLISRRSDFTQDYLAALAMRAGQSMYEPFQPAQLAALGLPPEGLVNFHPPTTIALLAPLTLLSYSAAITVWTLICIGLYLLTWWMVLRELRLLPPPALRPLLIAVSLFWFPFQFHIIVGQISIPLAACIVGAWVALRRGNDGWAGALLALAALLKIYPALLLAYLVLTGRWRAVASAAVVGLLGAGLTLALAGRADIVRYATEMVPQNLILYGASPINLSFHGMFSRLLVGEPRMTPLIEAPALAAALTLAANLGLLALVTVVLWRLPRDAERDTSAFALLCIAMVLITPTSWSHSLMVLALPLCLLAQFIREKPARLRLAGLIALLLSLPDLELARFIAQWYPGVPVPWYAMLPMLGISFGLLALFWYLSFLIRQGGASRGALP